MSMVIPTMNDQPIIHVGVFSPYGEDIKCLINTLTTHYTKPMTHSSNYPPMSYPTMDQLGYTFVFYEHTPMDLTRCEGSGLFQQQVVDQQQVSKFMHHSAQLCPRMDMIILITTSRITVTNETWLRTLSLFKLPILLLISDMRDQVGALTTEHISEYAKYDLFPHACLYVDFKTSENAQLDAILVHVRKLSRKLTTYQLAILAESISWQRHD